MCLTVRDQNSRPEFWIARLKIGMAWGIFIRGVRLLREHFAALPGYAQPLHHLSIWNSCALMLILFLRLPSRKECVFKPGGTYNPEVSKCLQFGEIFLFPFFAPLFTWLTRPPVLLLSEAMWCWMPEKSKINLSAKVQNQRRRIKAKISIRLA